MGASSSTPVPVRSKTPPPVLTDQPWRLIKGWSRGVRCDLKDHVAGLAPKTRGLLDVPFFNIALTGQIGAGKSSFFNGLNSIYQERIISGKAEVGVVAKSLTKEFRVYDIRSQPNHDPLPWRICDTMGLDPNLEVDFDVTNILKAVDGHVPNGFKFPEEDIFQDTPGYIPSPELKDKAHCVAVVVNGIHLLGMNNNMKRKLKTLRTGLITRNVPTYILLTHIDQACYEVNKDVTNVYRSIAIRDLVDKVSKMLLGLPENQIFPVMNYKSQIDLDDNMDILLLYPLRQMLYSAQGHLENRM